MVDDWVAIVVPVRGRRTKSIIFLALSETKGTATGGIISEAVAFGPPLCVTLGSGGGPPAPVPDIV